MKRLLLIIIFFASFSLFSQNDIDFCGYKDNFDLKKYPWKGNNQFLLDYIENYPLLDSSHIYFRVPICFHVYKNDRVSNANFEGDIKKLISRLNYIYSINKTGFFFYVSEVIFYNQPRHFVASYYTEAPIISNRNQHKFSINVYYVDVLQQNFFGNKKYSQGVYNSLTNSITIIKHSSKTTLAHEIGHFFGLKHPHQNWKRSKLKQESVSRTRKVGLFKISLNCEVNGDFLADTPAEPNLAYCSNSQCNYTYVFVDSTEGSVIDTLKDHWGDVYEPNVNNIMSYTANRSCRSNFTPMQRAVMLYTAANSPYSNIWKNCDTNVHFFVDNYEPDDKIYLSNILDTKKQYHTFHLYPANVDNQFKHNNIDWYEISAYEQSFIKINKANYIFPELKIIGLNNNDTILNVVVKNDTVINIENLGSMVYLKLENVSPSFTGVLYDYFISLGQIDE